jgi:D-threo-aldose 1-dehydrogenase
MTRLAAIGLGFASLGASEKPPLAADLAGKILESALALNIRRFDTSPLYGGGQSEKRLGELLIGLPRDSYILSTKVGRYRPYGEVLANQRNNPTDRYDYSADTTRRSIEKSLERLGVDKFDIVYIHDCDNFVNEAVVDALPALVQLRDEGVVCRIGVGSNNASTHEAMVKRADLDVLMVANSYSLLTQDADERLFPICQQRNISVELAAPFNSGILAVGPDDAMATYRYGTPEPEILNRTRQIAAVCNAHDVPLKRAALQYCARHPAVDCLILGLVEPKALRSNFADMQADIPPALWTDLAKIGVPVPKQRREKETETCAGGISRQLNLNAQSVATAH